MIGDIIFGGQPVVTLALVGQGEGGAFQPATGV